MLRYIPYRVDRICLIHKHERTRQIFLIWERPKNPFLTNMESSRIRTDPSLHIFTPLLHSHNIIHTTAMIAHYRRKHPCPFLPQHRIADTVEWRVAGAYFARNTPGRDDVATMGLQPRWFSVARDLARRRRKATLLMRLTETQQQRHDCDCYLRVIIIAPPLSRAVVCANVRLCSNRCWVSCSFSSRFRHIQRGRPTTTPLQQPLPTLPPRRPPKIPRHTT